MTVDDLQTYLAPDEHLVWWDAPKQGLLFTRRDYLLVPFSLVWAGIAVPATTNAFLRQHDIFSLAFAAVFGLTGIYFSVGRFALDAFLRRNMIYGLTGRRILILRGWPFAAFSSVDLDDLPAMAIELGRGGCGTIRFDDSTGYQYWTGGGGRGVSGWTPALSDVPQLLGIVDAKHVYDEIEKRRGKPE